MRDEFRKRCEEEKLGDPSLSGGTRDAYRAAFNHLERVLDADRLCKLTTETMSRFVRELRKPQAGTDRDGKPITLPPMKESTIACHLRHLKAALNWAAKVGLMTQAPRIDMPRAGDAKGRPITAEEFERMLNKVAEVRPHDPGVWTRHLYGLWLSGLRLQESLILSWDADVPFAVDLSGQFPGFRIHAKAQKARRSEKIPMTPDFASWLLRRPKRTGLAPCSRCPA